MLKPLTIAAAALSLVVPDAQLPGDRPAANPRATRSVVLARNGIIATSQPLASAAGLRVLQQGGNAIDAAVTAAAVLAVVEPTMNGVGGDLFAIVYDAKTKTVHGLNASGRAAAAATPDEFARRELDEIPYRGVLSVSVPGVVDGWQRAAVEATARSRSRRRSSRRSATRATASPSARSSRSSGRPTRRRSRADPAAAATFLPGGHAPAPGDVFRNPNLAATLERSRRGGRDAFYSGPIAQAIAADMKRARRPARPRRPRRAPRPTGSMPISTTYRGYDVLELPPNTQGVVALEMLNILEGFDLKALGHNSADYLHLLVEAKRIAFADRDARGSPIAACRRKSLARLMSKEYAAERGAGDRPAKAAARLRRADARRRASPPRRTAAAGPRRHDLPDRRRRRGQRRLADPVASSTASARASSPATPGSRCRTAAACSR